MFVEGRPPSSGKAVMLMAFVPEITRLLVATGGRLPMARFRVELVIASVLIGATVVPMKPATEVRLRAALVRLIELLIPPPLAMLLAATVPLFTFKVPVGRVLRAVPPLGHWASTS